ncbi:MAG TPA: hypothetical protein VLC11_08335 [Gemmatimonadales bacterium]|nr:hypothetical protein [Gemmatimonadales bacterium]
MSNWATPELNARLDAAFARAPAVGKWPFIWRTVCPPEGISIDALKQHFYKLQRQRGIVGPRSQRAAEAAVPDVAPDELAHQHQAPTPLSEAEMVALFRVDLTRWQVTALEHRTYHAGAKGPDGEIVTAPLYITRLRCKPLPGAESLVALADGLIADIRAAGASRPQEPPPLTPSGKYSLTVNTPDLHLGKLAYAPEAGATYDIAHAEEAARSGVEDLFEQTGSLPVEEVVVPIGNDLMQTDNLESTTTGGTRVDSDSRYHKMFRRACAISIWTAERAVRVAPVRIIIVPGNHDRLGAFHVGEVLAATFADHRFITVDNRPQLRKYHRYGQTLIGYTHGSEEKLADLPLIMLNEAKADMAATTCHEWHIGHFHRRREFRFTAGDTFHGVVVRVLSSLSAADAWHYNKGFVGAPRVAEAFWYHREDGFRGYTQSRVVQAGAA